MKNNLIITISRECGSGGRIIGEQLAKELGIDFYDRNIIDMAAKDTGFNCKFIEEEEKRITNSLLFNIATTGYMYGNIQGAYGQSITDLVFQAECDVIKDIAKKGSCVIVGRCADYILKDLYPCFDVFIHADFDTRLTMVMKEKKLDEKKAVDYIKKTDKARARHYQYYTNSTFGDAKNYDLSLNSAVLGINGCVEIIKKAVSVL